MAHTGRNPIPIGEHVKLYPARRVFFGPPWFVPDAHITHGGSRDQCRISVRNVSATPMLYQKNAEGEVDPLDRASILEEYIHKMVVAGQPDAIILFGWEADDAATDDSDFDFLSD